MTKQKWKKKKTLLSCASSASCLGIIRKAGARLEEREKCREEGERTRQKKKKRGHRDIDKDVVAAGNVNLFFFFFSQTWWLMNHRFSQTRGMRVGMVSVAFSIRKS